MLPFDILYALYEIIITMLTCKKETNRIINLFAQTEFLKCVDNFRASAWGSFSTGILSSGRRKCLLDTDLVSKENSN